MALREWNEYAVLSRDTSCEQGMDLLLIFFGSYDDLFYSVQILCVELLYDLISDEYMARFLVFQKEYSEKPE